MNEFCSDRKSKGLYFYTCNKPAKYVLKRAGLPDKFLCGIHRRSARRVYGGEIIDLAAGSVSVETTESQDQ